MKTQNAYLSYLQGLLPQGAAWTRERDAILTKILNIIAFELAMVDARASDLIREADPRTTLEMLEDWEVVAGLPDPCVLDVQTIQERRTRLVQKITRRGGQSINYFKAVANDIGYSNIEIREYRPFIAGINQCGDYLSGPPSVRYFWKVTVQGPRSTYFRAGASQAGDKLVSIARALDLECIFSRLKPAHTNLIFAYQGV